MLSFMCAFIHSQTPWLPVACTGKVQDRPGAAGEVAHHRGHSTSPTSSSHTAPPSETPRTRCGMRVSVEWVERTVVPTRKRSGTLEHIMSAPNRVNRVRWSRYSDRTFPVVDIAAVSAADLQLTKCLSFSIPLRFLAQPAS